jgi:hypothetical protein
VKRCVPVTVGAIAKDRELGICRKKSRNSTRLCAGMLLGLVTPLATALAQVAASPQ